MGGVNLADMRRLHCNSTILGKHRWWLKFFFYLLDVGTSNALVLYKETGVRQMNIIEFKEALIMSFVGAKLTNIEATLVATRVLERHDKKRIRCVYCGMFDSQKKTRTRFKCAEPSCNLPLCAVGHGNGIVDCFTLAHQNESIRRALVLRSAKMKSHCNKLGAA